MSWSHNPHEHQVLAEPGGEQHGLTSQMPLPLEAACATHMYYYPDDLHMSVAIETNSLVKSLVAKVEALQHKVDVLEAKQKSSQASIASDLESLMAVCMVNSTNSASARESMKSLFEGFRNLQQVLSQSGVSVAHIPKAQPIRADMRDRPGNLVGAALASRGVIGDPSLNTPMNNAVRAVASSLARPASQADTKGFLEWWAVHRLMADEPLGAVLPQALFNRFSMAVPDMVKVLSAPDYNRISKLLLKSPPASVVPDGARQDFNTASQSLLSAKVDEAYRVAGVANVQGAAPDTVDVADNDDYSDDEGSGAKANDSVLQSIAASAPFGKDATKSTVASALESARGALLGLDVSE